MPSSSSSSWFLPLNNWWTMNKQAASIPKILSICTSKQASKRDLQRRQNSTSSAPPILVLHTGERLTGKKEKKKKRVLHTRDLGKWVVSTFFISLTGKIGIKANIQSLYIDILLNGTFGSICHANILGGRRADESKQACEIEVRQIWIWRVGWGESVSQAGGFD